MRLNDDAKDYKHEADLTGLINIVFLILIFFIVAGALRPHSARNIELTKVSGDSMNAVAPGRLIAYADGRLTYRGKDLGLDDLATLAAVDRDLDKNQVFTVVADARLGSDVFLGVTRRLRAAGFKSIVVLSERIGPEP